MLKIAEFRMPTPQDVWKKGSKILKLPSVHNCFILAMTNKLVVIINSLKIPKIKKVLLYKMKLVGSINRTIFKKMKTETILKIYNTLVLPTFLYGSENWTITALQR